jgi:MtrB/PioB family decaheme-associated outer membrane protein
MEFCLQARVGFLVLSVVSSAQAFSQDTDPTANWRCATCPDSQGWALDLDFGPAYVGDDAFRFGDYAGLDEKGGFLFGDFAGRYQDSNARYFSFEGFTLSPSFTALFMEGGKQGVYRVRGSFQSIPRRFYDATLTPFLGNGSDTLSLPEGWVRAPNTSGMSAFAETAHPLKIERDWDVLRLGVDIKPASNWKIRADYARTERDGQNQSSGSFLFNATQFAQPVDYTTDDLELALAYTTSRWQTSLTYYGSFFDNGNDSLLWDNPFTGLDGADLGQIALSPDSESHQLSLAGSMVLPKRTVLSGQLAVGSLSQDENLLPYTVNTQINTSPLPRVSTDGEVETLNLNLRGVTSPWRKVTLEAEFRFNESDNRTPVSVYDYVVTDSATAVNPVTNVAYDYQRTDLKLRGEYRASSRLKLHLGFDTREFKRDFQERSRTNTDRLWFRMRHRLGKDADVDLDVFTEDRHGSSYDVINNPAAQQNPLMRKYNLSDRERYGIRLKGSLYPAPMWDFGWELEFGEDDYNESLIGLTTSNYFRAGADFSWLLRGNATAFASVFTEDVNIDQANSQSFSVPDWTATTDDRFTNLSLGLDFPALLGPVGVRLDYNWARSRGETSNNTSGLASEFPDLKSKRQTVRLGFSYEYTDQWVFGLDYLHEKVNSSDWALNGVDPLTVPNLLSLGADPFNYDVNMIYLSVRYRRPAR